MTPALALRTAGADAHLVARPRGVLHVARTSSLTPSGRFIPRSVRTVCRARTGRLHVVDLARVVSAATGDPQPVRLCARCSARLTRPGSRVGRAEFPTRIGVRDRYVGLDLAVLADDLAAARTEVDVDQVAHVALVLYGVPGCGGLLSHVTRHRRRVHETTAREAAVRHDIDMARVAAIGRRKADRAEVHRLREDRIAAIGINNAKPSSKGAPTP